MKRLILTLALVGLTASSLAAGGAGVTGRYVEARTAEVFVGGCIMNSEAGTAGRQAVMAWKVDSGAYNGVSLDGLSVVAAVSANRNLGIQEIGGSKPSTKAAVYVDERASVPQQMALIAMANELSNGIVGTVVSISASEVAFSEDGDGVKVAAGPVTLDIGKPQGREVLLKLLADADIFVENFRPGRLETWGIHYDDLAKINPRLVMIRLTGYGQTGPYAKQPGFGTIMEAQSGFAHMTGEAAGPPTLPQFALADSFPSGRPDART